MATNPVKVALVQTPDRMINQLQSNIVTPLNDLLKNEIVNNNLLKDIPLVIGTNKINHLLGRELIGWIITRKRSPANIYDSQDANKNPEVTLNLVSDAVVKVDILCL